MNWNHGTGSPNVYYFEYSITNAEKTTWLFPAPVFFSGSCLSQHLSTSETANASYRHRRCNADKTSSILKQDVRWTSYTMIFVTSWWRNITPMWMKYWREGQSKYKIIVDYHDIRYVLVSKCNVMLIKYERNRANIKLTSWWRNVTSYG